MSATKETWQEIAAGKRAALLASIPKEWIVPQDLLPPVSQDNVLSWPEQSGWFSPEELAITSLTATELVPKLASGALKSLDVTKAFCKRAAAAHQLVIPHLHSTVLQNTTLTILLRQTASPRHASHALSRRPKPATSTSPAQASP